jgi:hypothetical protein
MDAIEEKMIDPTLSIAPRHRPHVLDKPRHEPLQDPRLPITHLSDCRAGVSRIDLTAFAVCCRLPSVFIPNSVRRIYVVAFFG